MVLSPEHWTLLGESLSKDDHKVTHLGLVNIHLDDANVEQYCKV